MTSISRRPLGQSVRLASLLGLVSVLSWAGWPTEARADGFVADAGTVWTAVGYRHWTADRVYAGPSDRDPDRDIELGTPVPFDTTVGGGQSTMQAVEAHIQIVPVDRLEVGVYFPFWQRLEFSNVNRRTVTTGTGDIRPHVAVQLSPDGGDASTTVGLRGKIPTTALELDIQQIPLSEGQFDLAVDQQSTWRPLNRLQFTLTTRFRYRAPGRVPESNVEYKPGNEMVVGLVAGGEPVETVWLKLGYHGLWSTGWEARDADAYSRSRFRSHQRLHGGIYWSWGRLLGGAADGFAIDASVNWPLTGLDYPRATSFAIALAWKGRAWE